MGEEATDEKKLISYMKDRQVKFILDEILKNNIDEENIELSKKLKKAILDEKKDAESKMDIYKVRYINLKS